MQARRWFLTAMAGLPLLLGAAGCSRLGAFNAVMPKDGGSRLVAEGVAYGSDPRQKVDIYAPSATEAPRGTIVFVYGGSWNSGSRADYAFVGRAFASRGYLTVIPDYRLVPKIRYPAFVEDAAKAFAWTDRHISEYGGDAAKLYLVGHSAGAYNAAMLAVAPEFLEAEGLSPTSIRAFAGISGPYDFLPLAVDETREAFKGVKDLKSTQPVSRARRGVPIPPTLLLHGEKDDFVYPRNSRKLAAALRATGHSAEEIYYPEADHVGTLLAIARPLRGKAPVLDDIVKFLSRH